MLCVLIFLLLGNGVQKFKTKLSYCLFFVVGFRCEEHHHQVIVVRS